VSAHREENVDNQINLKDLIESLNYLASEYKYPIIFSTHPRTKKMLDKIKDIKINKLIKFMKPLGFFDYMKLQMNAYCIISDSGTITEESSILNLPAITIRNTHERPEGMDEGTLIMSGLKKNDVLNSVQIIVNQFIEKKQTLEVQDYKSINISTKIIRIIRSYTQYVNRTVWHK
jgi:UDP-N-acetylglucosamine 2-epimerase (non-hydrolysing)